MKNQNDLIVLIVALVVVIGAFCGTFFTMPQVPKPTPPEPVNTSTPQAPTGVEPVMASSLAGGGSGAGGGSAPMGIGGGGGASAGAGPGKMGLAGPGGSAAIPDNKKNFKGPQSMGGMR
ncbi:MAG TPA: hypothetical protein VHE55_01135 [Fimbriimonadaceae bacterium]|nr:hypothetical protein [Fimbriimonadaceae bacterium]